MQIENQENFRNKIFFLSLIKKLLLIKIQKQQPTRKHATTFAATYLCFIRCQHQPENTLQPLLQPNYVSSDVIPCNEY